MRTRPERLTAFSAFAALALGAAGMVFERADPSVLAAGPEQFSAWARAHRGALLAQSVALALGTAPLLVFFAGLRAVLRPHDVRTGEGQPLDLTLVVLGAGAVWVTVQLVGQALQVAMAEAAAHGESAAFVASLGDLMRTLLALGNLPLAAGLGAVAVTGLRGGVLPSWLTGLTAVTAVVHLVSVAGVRHGSRSSGGLFAYLPYPFFVGWMVSVAVSLLRRDGAGHDPADVRWSARLPALRRA